MVTAHIHSNEEKYFQNKIPQTTRESIDCDALNRSEVFQKSVEKARPSTTSKRIRPNHRDKESLLDELLELKSVVVDQEFHMRLHIQHHGQVQEKNKELEKSVENLELAYGLEAPRVGGESKLIAKLLGLKARLREKQAICTSQDVEICLLCKDIRVTHCRELEIERDLFATEVGILQKTIRGLRRVFVRINSENDEIQNTRQRISKLESANKELKINIESTEKSIEGAKAENFLFSNQSLATQSAAKTANSKLLELEKHSQVLAKLKHQEECETLKLEHSILNMGDDTRQILKDKITAEKQALYNATESTHVEIKRKFKAPEQPRDSPSGDAMTQLEAQFIAQVETTAVEFVETVSASQPPSPKTEEQLKDQHVIFENRKYVFTEKVEDADIQFLMAMEEIEYGKAKTKLGQSMAKRLATVEKARLAAEKERQVAEKERQVAEKERQVAENERQVAEKERQTAEKERQVAEALAKKFAKDAKKAQEEVIMLQAKLEKLRAMGSGDKRWKNEKVTVMLGEELLKPSDYKVEVFDKGAEIDIDVDISTSGMSSRAPSPDDDEDVAATNRKKLEDLNSAKTKAEAEAKRLEEEMKKTQEERDRLATELANLQSMGAGSKRWKKESLDCNG